jgi:hypothetical protein
MPDYSPAKHYLLLFLPITCTLWNHSLKNQFHSLRTFIALETAISPIPTFPPLWKVILCLTSYVQTPAPKILICLIRYLSNLMAVIVNKNIPRILKVPTIAACRLQCLRLQSTTRTSVAGELKQVETYITHCFPHLFCVVHKARPCIFFTLYTKSHTTAQFITLQHRSVQIFQISNSHLKILGYGGM